MLLSRPLNTLFSIKYDYSVQWDVNNQLLAMRWLSGATQSHPARTLASLVGVTATAQQVAFPQHSPGTHQMQHAVWCAVMPPCSFFPTSMVSLPIQPDSPGSPSRELEPTYLNQTWVMNIVV